MYAVQSQAHFHGFAASDALIQLGARPGEHYIRTADIEAAIAAHRDELALVLWPGVQYYSGQFFELERICRAASNASVPIGLDLAHAVGNVPLALHDWEVSFAVWCHYKYLNSGPGGISKTFFKNVFLFCCCFF